MLPAPDHPLLKGPGSCALVCAGGDDEKGQLRAGTLMGYLATQNLPHDVLDAKFHQPERAFLIHGATREQAWRAAKAGGADAAIFAAGGQRELLKARGQDDGVSLPEAAPPEVNAQEPADNFVKLGEGSHATFRFDPNRATRVLQVGVAKTELHMEFQTDVATGDKRQVLHQVPVQDRLVVTLANAAPEVPMTKAEIQAELLLHLKPLVKSKNVREQTRNISHGTAHDRIMTYIRRSGFRPVQSSNPKFAVGSDQRELNYVDEGSSDGITPQHEMGHALMTPVGQTMGEYQAKLGPFGQFDNSGQQEEVAAVQMQPGIMRRSGVRANYRNFFPAGKHPEGGLWDTAAKRAKSALGAHETGALAIDPGGRVVPGTSLDGKINQGTAGTRGLKRGEDEEPTLMKSKNVREQTKKISAKQAFGRREAYARQIGLQPKTNDDKVGLPNPAVGNTMEHSRTFPVEHETGHAVMTPPGKSLGDYHGTLENIAGTAEGAHHENTATQAEYGIDRRAGVRSWRTSMRDFKADNGSREYDARYRPPPADAEFEANPKATTPSSNQLVAKPALRDAANSYLNQFDMGARFTPTGHVQQPSDVNAKINRGEAGVNSLKALRQRASMQKTEDEEPTLMKRSKNVREQTRNISRSQAVERRLRYIRSTGLIPEQGGFSKFPAANRNKLQYGGNFNPEHEFAHAAMTPDGKTIRQYQHQLNANAEYRPASDDDFDDNAIEHEEGVNQENTANAMEDLIDRRSGVSPHVHAPMQRAAVKPDSTDDFPEDVVNETAGSHNKTRQGDIFTPDLHEQAAYYVNQFDRGAKFNSRGRIEKPTGINAKINQGTGGVNSLKALRERAKAGMA